MPAGRPRAFDCDDALDRALQVFWQKGFEGASLPELTKAMGINRPSLYAAFGNKESLFRKAVDRYLEGPARHTAEALAAPTAREVAERLLMGTVDLVTDPARPRGCFIVQAALACGDEAEPVRRELAQRRAAGEVAILARLEQAIADGDLPKESHVADLARFLVTLMHGFSVQAASGASRESLQRVAKQALQAWPKGALRARKTQRK